MLISNIADREKEDK